MTTVTVKGVGDIEFPDSMTAAEIQDVLRKKFGGKRTPKPTAADRVATFGSGVNDAVANFNPVSASIDFVANRMRNRSHGPMAQILRATQAKGTPTLTMPDIPVSENPIGGSQWVRQNLLPTPHAPQDTAGQYTNAAGQGVGGALVGALGGNALAELGPAFGALRNMLPQTLRGVTGELGLGAASGVGAKAGQDIGGPAGAVVGGLALPVAASGAAVPLRFGKNVLSPFFESGVERHVGNALRESSTFKGNVRPQQAPVPGVELTTGQATNDPGLLALERSVQMKTPHAQGAFKLRASEQNQALRRPLEGLAGDADAAGQVMQQELQAGLERAKAKAGKAYDHVAKIARGLGNAKTIKPTETRKSIQALLKQHPDIFDRLPDQALKRKLQSLSGSLQDQVSTSQPKILLPNGKPQEPVVTSTPQTLSFDDARFLRQQLGNYLRRAYRSPGAVGSEETNAIGRIRSALEGDVKQWAKNSGNNHLVDALRKADDVYQNEVVPFKGAPLKNAVSTDEAGAPRTAPSRLGPAFIKSSPGGKESLDAYIKATGGTPRAMQAARDYFGDRLLQAAQRVGVDEQGDRLVNAGALRKFTDNNRKTIKRLYTPEQQKVIQAIVDSAEMATRTARAGIPGGSDTAAKIGGQRFIDGILGARFGSRAYFLGRALEGVGNVLYAGPNAKIDELLRKAMLDPKLASKLLLKATPTNARFLPKAYRASILGMLGQTSTARASQESGG